VTTADYYKILDLQPGCSVEELKKAYRKKAREYHPDINHSNNAKDMFIKITEAYEFLLTYFDRMASDERDFNKAMDEWRKYRKERSQQKARAYAQTSFVRFKNTNFYKTTRIFDGTTIISSLIVAILVLVISIYGYIYRIHHPIPGVENPSIIILIIFLILGMILFITSIIFLKAYLLSSKKNKRRL
jgi:hypothetical protein